MQWVNGLFTRIFFRDSLRELMSEGSKPKKNIQRRPSKPGESSGLDELRGQIDRIDHDLVGLLAERQHVVERIVELKQQQDLPTFHPAREENLISQRRQQGRDAGLDPDYLEDLFRTVLRHSRVGQLETLSRRALRPGAKVLLVGGRGSMGSFFARWFAQSDYEVRVLDRHDWPKIEQLTPGIDLCVLAVPIDVTAAVAFKIAPHLPRNCVLADITSLKAEPLKAMLSAYSGAVLGLHPLFGPTTSTMDKQIIVVTPGRHPENCEWLLDQLRVWGNVLVETTPEEHDRVMGIVQALRHFATFAFGQFLCSRGVPIFRTLELSSPIYRLELAMVGRLFAQDPSLYAEIIFATPERQALLKEFVESFRQNLPLIESGDKAEFIARFQKIAEWFGPFSEQAMRESNFLVDKLVHRF